uniref:G_PROTEIN_RECEP_F2_4 domain-containing protein n=1 Tax=Steinernema glaseri TaxID=37863 RepID=A0A1I7Z2W4_9BILA
MENLITDLNFSCKAFSFLWNYSIFASYVWISIEGYYLFSIIYRSVFNGDISCKRFMITGWGVPFVFVSIWAVFMELYSNSPCWIQSCNPNLVWLLKTPLGMFSVANFFFTILLFAQLYKKLCLDDHLDGRYKYTKLLKSTICVLLSMGGVYFIIDIVVFATSPDVVTNIHIHMFYVIYNSLISVLIAYLFCFNNSEIKQALQSKRRVEKGSEGPTCAHAHLLERLVVGGAYSGCAECQVEMKLMEMKEVSPTISAMLASACDTVCTTVESSAHNTVTKPLSVLRPRVSHLSYCREAEEEDLDM